MSNHEDAKSTPASNRAGTADELIPIVYDELRRMAAVQMTTERPSHSLTPTAIVHELYLRLSGGDGRRWADRSHFVQVAAQCMRRVLVDHARKKNAKKRGGNGKKIEIDVQLFNDEIKTEDVIELDLALNKLGQRDELASKLVELRFFVGMTNLEAAEQLGISPRKANMLWAFARAWLKSEMEQQ